MARKKKTQTCFDKMYDEIVDGMKTVMSDAGEQVAQEMVNKLEAGHHRQTGNLINSVHYKTKVEGDKIVTTVYANAKSDEGTQYGEFLEEGTGAAHGRAGGRVGYWRYKDSNGQWHTTNGMDADPFIEPSVEKVLPAIDDMIDDVLYNIEKYGK